MQDQWEAVVTGRSGGLGASAGRLGLRLGAGLYAAGLKANLWLYTSGLKRRTQPSLPVISVGNLSLGGTGKTTTTAFLAQALLPRVKPGIVLRGHGRSSSEAVLIVSDGSEVKATPAEAGDEAVMLARQLPGVAVAVGKRRETVIEALRSRTGAQVAVLDDGFQYFRMARELDLVLLDALAGPEAWRLFPAGRLREPVTHLQRASQVWITHADLASTEHLEQLRTLARRYCPNCPVVVTRHREGVLRPLSGGGAPVEDLRGQKVVAVSALGNPQSYEMGLEKLGAQVTPARFPDHHRYVPEDYERIKQTCRASGAGLVVTTEKDAVKLPPPPEDCPPVVVMSCGLEVLEGLDEVESALQAVCDQVQQAD
ncbi:tetraacyldisaccharide 4'-kinase [bacterium]|nr:tetraacyldisaccharide 4'-kinase [bacterium]